MLKGSDILLDNPPSGSVAVHNPVPRPRPLIVRGMIGLWRSITYDAFDDIIAAGVGTWVLLFVISICTLDMPTPWWFRIPAVVTGILVVILIVCALFVGALHLFSQVRDFIHNIKKNTPDV